MPRARLIYNPTAGRELIKKQLPQILDCLEQAGYETSCRATQYPWHAAEEAALAADRGYDIVIAAGGDGTIHEVVNGIAPYENPPKLGILPAGTTNDFARALKLPRDLYEACQVITSGKTMSVDLGRYGDRYFINVAAVGKLAEVAHEAPSRLKTLIGSLAYYAKAIEKLSSFLKPFPVQIKTAQGEYEGEISLLLLTNSVSVGGFERIAPEARINDGFLDVLIISKVNIPELVQLAAQAYKGEHISNSRVIYFQTDQIELKTGKDLPLNLDGEWGGEIQGSFSVLPRHLEVFCP
ncbi:diacylglycerol kinase [Thermoflavimicrobium dichotomicum]|uniref:Diacylglycerol kinase (ATP) n=1 Tax=Thermoflavimicrobium dichotomicum TaxID=46223 RepID=A0A1I3RHE6_9BACL|nr:diacylglycerol kinase [Thermoflavimicrobium dichotomicum]SFJ45705.1 diacylglycerol kinase (ATP) [Thermoflavimicrobium dichotomicum]